MGNIECGLYIYIYMIYLFNLIIFLHTCLFSTNLVAWFIKLLIGFHLFLSYPQNCDIADLDT